MPRYFLHLAYNGADYHGWQSQPNAVTVQETVEKALSRVLRRQVAIVGAGRTDTGVNARSMYAHFDVDNEIADPQRLISALNSLVGRDIAIYGIRRVADDAHARWRGRISISSRLASLRSTIALRGIRHTDSTSTL